MKFGDRGDPGGALFTAERIRVGVIGLGRAGSYFHCRPISQNPFFELRAVQDMRRQVAEEIAAKYGCKCHSNPVELMSDPEVDLVVIAVPTREHGALAFEAIRLGTPILVEKPFAMSLEEAEAIFEKAASASVPVFIYHNRRFDADVLALDKILQSGKLGQIVKVSIHLHSFTRRRDWQTLRDMGGGALANWGAHAIDWVFRLFGPQVSLSGARLFHVLNPGDAEDSFILNLNAGRTAISIEYLNCAAISLPKWHVVGTCGSAISLDKAFHLRYCDPGRLIPVEVDNSAASDGTYGIREDLGWQDEQVDFEHWDNCPRFLEALHAHLKGNAPPPVEPEDVLAQLRLMEKIRAEGEFVKFAACQPAFTRRDAPPEVHEHGHSVLSEIPLTEKGILRRFETGAVL